MSSGKLYGNDDCLNQIFKCRKSNICCVTSGQSQRRSFSYSFVHSSSCFSTFFPSAVFTNDISWDISTFGCQQFGCEHTFAPVQASKIPCRCQSVGGDRHGPRSVPVWRYDRDRRRGVWIGYGVHLKGTNRARCLESQYSAGGCDQEHELRIVNSRSVNAAESRWILHTASTRCDAFACCWSCVSRRLQPFLRELGPGHRISRPYDVQRRWRLWYMADWLYAATWTAARATGKAEGRWFWELCPSRTSWIRVVPLQRGSNEQSQSQLRWISG